MPFCALSEAKGMDINMQRYIINLFLAVLICILTVHAIAEANNQVDTVLLKLNENQAKADGVPYELEIAPQAKEGITMVPLRYLAEIFGAQVDWNEETRQIYVQQNDNNILLQQDSDQILLNGEIQTICGLPTIENGITLVPLRFLVESLNYKVDFVPDTKEINIKQLQPPNKSPVADFSINQNIVAQGETVLYEDKSSDPDGDQIVEGKWTGNERAFFAQGEYKVTLTVKDSNGAWSEPCTKIVTVTDEVKMDRLTYNLNNPVSGEPLGNLNISVMELKQFDPAVSMAREEVLVSNSPEIIKENGILYSDILSGENRLYFHHINGSNENKRVFLLAINQEDKPVSLVVKKWGVAGPAGVMSVGRAAAYRFLDFDPRNARFIKLQPGEQVIINEGMNNILKPGQAINALFDVDSNDDLLYSVVAVGSKDQLVKYENIPILFRDNNHIRGTFSLANRSVSVQLDGEEPARLIVADGKDDEFLYGKDTNTSTMGRYSLRSKNTGNYGVVYRVRIGTQHRVGVIFSPRGGVFAGAGAWDGQVFYLPNKGILKPQTEYAMIGVVEPGKEKVLEFIPPAGSFLPINLIFIPF